MKFKKVKIFSVFSNIEYANEFYWYAKYLDNEKYSLICIFLNPKQPPIQKMLNELNIKTYFIPYYGKKSLISASIRIALLLLKHKPDIIHPQLFDAAFITLTVAKILCFKKTVYTRHHSDYHHIYHPKAVKFDKWQNLCSKKIICPSEQTKRILQKKENVSENKIVVIPHAFNFSSFNISYKEHFREKYKLNTFPIIGVVSRFTEWKGVQYIVPAFKKFLMDYPNALLVLAGTKGDYEKEIGKMLLELPTESYRLIEFEPEIYSLMANFDIFVHVPTYKEAETFGQVYVEAFALGIPSTITLSGVAADDDLFYKYAEVVKYMNSDNIYKSMLKIVNNYNHYKAIMFQASKEAKEKYSFSKKIEAIEKLYYELMNY